MIGASGRRRAVDGLRGTVRLLTSPGMLLVVGAAFVSGATNTMFRPLVAPFAVNLGAGPFLASVIVAAFSLPGFLLAVPAGAAARRFGERGVLMVGGGLLAAAGAVVALGSHLVALAAGMLVAGTGAVCVGVATQGAATAPVGDGGLDTRRVAAFGIFIMVGQMVGPVLGGVLSDLGGYSAAFWGVVGLGLVMMVVGVLSPRRRTDAPIAAASAGESDELHGPVTHNPFRQATDVFRVRLVPTALGLSALGTILLNIRTSFLPLYLDQIGWSASAIGALLSWAALAGLLSRGAFPALERRLSPGVMYGTCLVGSAVALGTVVLTVNAPVIAVAAAVSGALLAGINPVSLTFLARLVDETRRQMVIGVRITVRHVAQMSGPLAFGAIAGATSVRAAFLAVAGLTGLAAGVGSRRLSSASKTGVPRT